MDSEQPSSSPQSQPPTTQTPLPSPTNAGVSPVLPEKKSRKKVVLIVVGVIAALIALLALVPTPKEEPAKPRVERPQPSNTKVERFADSQVEYAVPNGWVEEKNIEIQNAEDTKATQDKLNERKLNHLYYDPEYKVKAEGDDAPSINLFSKSHSYKDNKTALSKVSELESDYANKNGHNVAITKEKVQVGKFGTYEAYLYSGEDTFDKTTTEKLKIYRLIVAAHGKYYYSYGTVPVTALDKYDAIVKASVLSVNPDE